MAANSDATLRGPTERQALAEARSVPAPAFDATRPAKRSMCTTHPACSVLEPARSAPSESSTGLARMGPRIPAGSLTAADHVLPLSTEVRTSPHHARGLGPTL